MVKKFDCERSLRQQTSARKDHCGHFPYKYLLADSNVIGMTVVEIILIVPPGAKAQMICLLGDCIRYL
jgi:hypothetical protein